MDKIEEVKTSMKKRKGKSLGSAAKSENKENNPRTIGGLMSEDAMRSINSS